MRDAVARKTLGALNAEVLIPLPHLGRWHVAYHVTGTFVGTLKGASSTTENGSSMTDRTSRSLRADTSGDPTDEGEHVFDCEANAKWAKVYFSAYTSGEAEVTLHLVPRG